MRRFVHFRYSVDLFRIGKYEKVTSPVEFTITRTACTVGGVGSPGPNEIPGEYSLLVKLSLAVQARSAVIAALPPRARNAFAIRIASFIENPASLNTVAKKRG